MKQIQISSGERRRIVRRWSNSIPGDYSFTAEPANPGQPISGTVEVIASKFPWKTEPTTNPLQPENTIHKKWWDSYFWIYVIPRVDAVITVEDARMTSKLLIGSLVVLIVLAALAVFLISLGT